MLENTRHGPFYIFPEFLFVALNVVNIGTVTGVLQVVIVLDVVLFGFYLEKLHHELWIL